MDRLADLQAGWEEDDLNYQGETKDEEKGLSTSNSKKNIEQDTTTTTTSSTFMTDFFEKVDKVKESMRIIRRQIDELEQCSGEAVAAVMDKQRKQLSAQMDQLIDSINMERKTTKQLLDQMKKECDQNKGAVGGSEDRIRQNMLSTLSKKFIDLMNEFEQTQTQYQDQLKKKIERQIRTVNVDATEEEIQEAIDSGGKDIFADAIQDKRFAQEAEDALTYVETKHKEIQRLEASIQELHQLFLDMAVLVEAQGELIDQIEHNVQQSVAYTGQGVKQLKKAVKTQRKNRKLMCCIVICLLILLAIIVLITQL